MTGINLKRDLTIVALVLFMIIVGFFMLDFCVKPPVVTPTIVVTTEVVTEEPSPTVTPTIKPSVEPTIPVTTTVTVVPTVKPTNKPPVMFTATPTPVWDYGHDRDEQYCDTNERVVTHKGVTICKPKPTWRRAKPSASIKPFQRCVWYNGSIVTCRDNAYYRYGEK